MDQGQGKGQAEGGPLGLVPGQSRLCQGEDAGHVLCGGPEDLQLLQPGQGQPQPHSLHGWKLLPGHQRSHSLSLTSVPVAVSELVSYSNHTISFGTNVEPSSQNIENICLRQAIHQ